MIISHNISAMMTNRQLGIQDKELGKAAERLSSGYKINRAADNASGLSISEKMRGQIRGLNRASQNIQDGISLIQVADAALNETHAVLHRARELAVKAANDINVDADRQAIQSEIDQLLNEVDRIAKDTNFNRDIYPLAGGKIQEVSGSTFLLDNNVTEITFTFKNIASDGLPQYYNGKEYQYGETATLICIDIYNPIIGRMDHELDGAASYNGSGEHMKPGLNAGHYYDGSYNLTMRDLKTDEEGRIYYTSKRDGNNYYFYRSNESSPTYQTTSTTSSGEYLMNPKFTASDIWIQMGANEDEDMVIDMVDATTAGIGLTSIDVSSNATAGAAITNIDAAIEKVSEFRSEFGARQNRLEHAKATADNTAENTQAAESRIRDTDMADEMVEYSKRNILRQSAQSMLAQTNQAPQGILKLLE